VFNNIGSPCVSKKVSQPNPIDFFGPRKHNQVQSTRAGGVLTLFKNNYKCKKYKS